MPLFRRNKDSIGESIGKSRIPDRKSREFIENVLRVPIHKMADSRAYLEVGSKHVWASYRSCDIVASVVLSTVFRVRGQNTGAEVEDKALSKLMTTPNPFDSWEEMLYQWVFHMKLTGSAFWYKDQIDKRGRPLHVYPLIPQYVTVVPHEKDRISHYVYKVNGKEIRMATEDIIHFRRPHPSHVINGMGDIEPSEPLYKEYIMRGKMEERFLSNGAMPSGILSKKEAVEDEEEWGKLKKWWKVEYEGKENVGKTAFLNGEWSYQKLGLTHTEMQSLENEKWSISQIFNNHGVPLSIAGLEKAANYATAKQDSINFRRHVVVPLLDILVGKLNGVGIDGKGSFIKAFSPQWKLAYELSGLINVENTVKEYRPLLTEGAITPNDLRELCGLERVKDPLLDQYFINSNRIPIEMSGLSAPTEEEVDILNNDADPQPKEEEGDRDDSQDDDPDKPDPE